MLTFWDANCIVGKRQNPREGSLQTTKQVVEMMEKCRVERAVVCHSAARECAPQAGNLLLEQEIAGLEQFYRQWVVMPSFWGEFPTEDQLLREMKQNGVCSVRLMPGYHGYSMLPYSAGRLMEALAQSKVPVFVEKNQMPSWESIYTMCQNYPQTRFVLTEPGYRCIRYLAPIMETCSNLWVETSDLVMHEGIRDFCRYYGADRLLFGSGVPTGSMAAAVSLISLADISEAEKKRIASENLRGLLEEVAL